MAWTTPKTWTSEVLTSNDMNTYLSDNTQYLYDELSVTLPSDIYTRTTGDYSTTSTTYVDIDATNMSTTITTTGGDVLITFTAAGAVSGVGLLAYFALVVDGVENEVIHFRIGSGDSKNCSFVYTFTGLAAGSHTFVIRYKVSSSTLTIQGDSVQWTVRELG